MKIIAKIKFGSHLYGTNTPESDLDIKGVYIPCAKDILLQQTKPMISESRVKARGEKNTSEDIDFELYSLQRFLELLAQGQTVALDMLFAPNNAMLSPASPVWYEIKEKIAPKIITKEASSFVKYCHQQANKYGIKGSRVAASRQALKSLEIAEQKYGPKAKLQLAIKELQDLSSDSDFISIVETQDPSGKPEYYLDVCGKKSQFTASIETARKTVSRLVSEYGHRALAAEKNEGVDWKALSHAVRVGNEAIELLSTGKITFPRPEADFLLQIKQGKLNYPDVARHIEELLEEVEKTVKNSTLPDYPDLQIINDFIITEYRKQVNTHE